MVNFINIHPNQITHNSKNSHVTLLWIPTSPVLPPLTSIFSPTPIVFGGPLSSSSIGFPPPVSTFHAPPKSLNDSSFPSNIYSYEHCTHPKTISIRIIQNEKVNHLTSPTHFQFRQKTLERKSQSTQSELGP